MAHPEANGNQPNSTTCPEWGAHISECITISKWEYASLLQSAQEYETLKKALYDGGVAPETLEILIDGNAYRRKDSVFDSTDWAYDENSTDSLAGPGNTTNQFPSHTYDPLNSWKPTATVAGVQYSPMDAALRYKSSVRVDETPLVPSEEDDADDGLEYIQGIPRKTRDSAVGTLQITGLSDLITHRDLTDAIRGGPIVSLVIHKKSRTATVAMFDGASDFLAQVKRNDLYVQCKRLDVKWSHRQYRLSEHIRRQISKGATRNLVIRKAARRFSERGIRDDMAHIDSLVIIAIVFRGLDVYIYTNSVPAALFARTCMLSRKMYSNLRIEHFPDDCADPLPMPSYRQQHVFPPPGLSCRKPTAGNMFKVLANSSDGNTISDGDSVSGINTGDSSDSRSADDPLVSARADDDDGIIDESDCSEGVRLSDF